VLRRARSQTDYKPVFEDWLCHTALPLVAYTSILAAAVRLSQRPMPLFVIGAATILLLFVGIHNSWDTVTYIVLSRKAERSRDEKAS